MGDGGVHSVDEGDDEDAMVLPGLIVLEAADEGVSA